MDTPDLHTTTKERCVRASQHSLIPIGVFAVLLVAALNDGYFRDEFYYIACSYRLDWGYVDHPPLSIAILWAVRHFAGESVIVLRVTAALVAALTVWMTGSIARRLGASAFGESLAMIAVGTAPVLLAIGSVYSMNVLDVLIWTTAARVLLDVLDRPANPRWLLLGLVLGLGLENKISVLWLGLGLIAGIVLTSARRSLLTPGPWLAALIAGAAFAPHVFWQVVHGWPTLEFIQNATRDKMQTNTPVQFWASQVLNMNPVAFPVWLAGLIHLLVAPHGRRYRVLGVSFIAVATILIANRTSRSVYLAAAYPMLFAAGGVALERMLERNTWRAAAVMVLLLAGVITTPLALPLLSTERYVGYSEILGFAPGTEEKKQVGRLPQFFADRQGWDQFVDQVAEAFNQLSPSERPRAAVLATNYGEAGAIELLGRSRRLVAISGHNNYWLWGPAGHSGDVLIVLSRSTELHEERFGSVKKVGDINCGDCMPYENRLSIFICRDMKPPTLPDRWISYKHYD